MSSEEDETQPQITRAENFVKFGHVVFEIARGQTDRQTYRQTYRHADRGRSTEYRHDLCSIASKVTTLRRDRNVYIIRPHRSRPYYVDEAYCYRLSSVVCLSVTIVSPAKTAEPIEMPFAVWTRVGPMKPVLYVCAHWRHLANTVEPSVYGGDAALCQMTSTTYYGNTVTECIYALHTLRSWLQKVSS